jgi:hypothetical protein
LLFPIIRNWVVHAARSSQSPRGVPVPIPEPAAKAAAVH